MAVRVELPSPNQKWIFIVETDLSLNPTDPGYDAEAVQELAKAVIDEANRLNVTEIEIVPV
jgi:hypothetical protein